MNPHSKPRPLIFTPRSPWGRLPQKRTAQSHMRASEDKKPDPSGKNMQGLSGQPVEPGRVRTRQGSSGMDLYEDQKSYLRKADDNGVPSSLQSQITPERASEILNPSPQPPLSARPKPSLKDMAYPAPAQQASPANAGSGELRPPAKAQGQQMLSPSEADTRWEKEPKKNPFKNPLNYKGLEIIPKVNPHGFELEGKVDF